MWGTNKPEELPAPAAVTMFNLNRTLLSKWPTSLLETGSMTFSYNISKSSFKCIL